MTKNLVAARRMWIVTLVAAAIIAGWALPLAAGQPFAEAPRRVQTKGLTAEQELRRQVVLSERLGRELPAEALDKAFRIALTPAEIAGIDRAPSTQSPLRIGLVKALRPAIEIGATGHLAFPTAQGGLAWTAVVRTEGAGATRLHVTDLWLPARAELYVHSRDGQVFGPYSGPGPNGTGDFWTPAIFGSEVILQLRLVGPTAELDLRDLSFKVVEAGLITQKFARGLRDGGREPQGPPQKASWPCGNQSCVVDAGCVSGSFVDTLQLAMAKMEWISGAFIFTCTGGLLSDNNPTQSNFFLTANHCLSKNSAAQNASFYWRFGTSSCNTVCPENNGWPMVTTGSRVAATNRKGDFTLLQLNTAPPAGSVFLGWTNAPVANSNGTDLFRVSNPGFGPQVYSSHDVDTSAGTCRGWPRGQSIYSRDLVGAIDGGSSGSPIVNAAGQVVGQLSGTCGTSPSEVCASGPGEANATVDGALAFYFSQVQPFLNP